MPATYDRSAKKYDRMMAPLERRLLARLRSETLLLIPDGSRVLEVGCGTGANFPFYPKNCHAVGSEISFKMLEIARAKNKEIAIVQADAQELPFPTDHFDAAFATLVFCTVPEPDKGLSELRRVVRPGGRVVLLEHVRPDGVLGGIFDAINLITATFFDDHFNRRTAELAERSGLRILEVRKKAFGIVNLVVCGA